MVPVFAYRLGLSVLTLGIALGSYWAYHELGWGGFWYWDPVEVISLIPWMLYLMGFHAVAYHSVRHVISLISWPMVLLCFGVVRSGALNSVHSFAQDPSFLIHFAILMATTVIPPIIYSIRKYPLHMKAHTSLMSVRLFAPILWGIMLVLLIVSVCLPLAMNHMVFGADFFKATLWPLLLPLLVLMAIVPKQRISLNDFLFGFIPSGIVLYGLLDHPDLTFMSMITLTLCVFGSVLTVLHMMRHNYKRLLGHLGWFGLIASCVLTADLSKDYPFEFHKTNTIKLHKDISLHLRDVKEMHNKQYLSYLAKIDVKHAEDTYTFKPQIKYYKLNESVHSTLATNTHYLSQTGIVIENLQAQTLKGIYYDRPYIHGLWISVLIILVAIFL
ncbi:MAG: cytochrome c biogenesis protein CcsA [Alphaproteobacteria bacterium]|nr:cytochrome c biogenesis protein CcsA [Alphaproteobacteria bacterium]